MNFFVYFRITKKNGMDLDKAVATQLANIEKRSGKTLAELGRILESSGLKKHTELRDLLKTKLGMGHGDANTVVHLVLKSDGRSAAEASGLPTEEVIAGFYTGPKAALFPIHQKLLKSISAFGEFELAPKKNYVSLRRKKQFAMIGPATNTRIDVGINIKELPESDRLQELPPKGMCNYKVQITHEDQVDQVLLGWLQKAYEAAG